MKLKFCLVFFLFLFALSSSFSNTGLGASFSYSASTKSTSFVSFTARTDVSPWVIFFNAHFEKNVISFFADDWFINERLGENVDYFVLWGISGGCNFTDDVRELCTGCRFGAGLDLFFLNRKMEFFAQTVWNPYFGVKKESGDFSPVFRPVNFPCTAGLRLWF